MILQDLGVDYVTEYCFAKKIGRHWRSDFYVPCANLLIEYEGGVFTHHRGRKRSRHLTPSGYSNDCQKYNWASLLGYRVLRYTKRDLEQMAKQVSDEIRLAVGQTQAR